MNTTKANLEQAEEDLVVYIDTLAKCIAEETQVIADAEAKIKANKEKLAHAKTICNEYFAEYDRATAEREKETQEIEDLKAYIS